MGVKFGREYHDIIHELSAAVGKIGELYTFFEMSVQDWQGLEEAEQRECVQTLADDIFYGLGADPVIRVGRGIVSHDRENHVLKINDGDKLVSVVHLT